MNSILIATKDAAAIVKATFPDYRRKQVRVQASETVTFYELNWSGGTKNEYRACSIDGRQSSAGPDMGIAPPWANPHEGKTIELPAGYCVVRGGHFCGKISLLTIYVHPADMPKYLPHA